MRLRRGTVAAALLLLAGSTVTATIIQLPAEGYSVEDRVLAVPTGPQAAQTVRLDTSLYLPRSAGPERPVPAVLLAHDFGESKATLVDDARQLVAHGFAVLAWSAAGFGESGGEIHLDDPQWEVSDARRLVDWLAQRPDIVQDAPGDPRVAAVGTGYGGALAILLAGYDTRLDAIVPMQTWHDLGASLLPDAVTADPARGVLKRQWLGVIFGDSTAGGCGRFAREICDVYIELARSARPGAQTLALLRRSSPASVADRVTAPTLLIQGAADSLFPLSDAEANARAIGAAGTPVRQHWITGGHDRRPGPFSDRDRLRQRTVQWLDWYLAGRGAQPGTGLTFSRVTSFTSARMTEVELTGEGLQTTEFAVRRSLSGPPLSPLMVAGAAQRIVRPVNGIPAAISTLPALTRAGVGGVTAVDLGVETEIPGQHASFDSAVLTWARDIIGTPRVRIRVASSTGDATLFAKLYDVQPDGRAMPVGPTIAPARLVGLSEDLAQAAPVELTLPTIAQRIAPGHRLRVTISTTDQAFALEGSPAEYTVAVDGAVLLPTATAELLSTGDAMRWTVLLCAVGAGVLILAGISVVARRRRRAREHDAPQDVALPLVVRCLRKEFRRGFPALSGVDFRVAPNSIIGLLGSNGAGKTTTLRIVVGLARKTSGEVYVFGQPIYPGAGVLSRVGALIDGPGLAPHLSGVDNLLTHWRVTGRPDADAHLAEVLEISGLGSAVHRKVSTYSYGMRQRLAIAQAMLGLPDLLLLDEPANGLDPPQANELRRALQAYARDGRAVVISSHILAEVESLCTDVVIMHKGTVVAAGPIDDVTGEGAQVQLSVSNPKQARQLMEAHPGVDEVHSAGRVLVATIAPGARATVVAALVNAGIDVDEVRPQRRLEDAFLALTDGGAARGGDR